MKKKNVTILLLIAILFLFFIPACREKTDSKDSKVKKNSKTEKTITDDAVAVAPETQNPITEAAVESQPANGETENNPPTEEFIPDPPVTATDTSVQFVVGAPVVDKQVFDTTDSKVIEAFNAYYSAFNDNMPLIFFNDCYSSNINKDVKNMTQLIDSISPRKLRRFSIIDLDNDSLPEIVLSNGEYEDDFLIFKHYNDYVYVYRLVGRGLIDLKIDSTFGWGAGAQNNGIAAILLFQKTGISHSNMVWTKPGDYTPIYYINSETVSEEKFKAAEDYQNNKPDADWYEFTEENITNTFPQK